jgi:hypothetical protein
MKPKSSAKLTPTTKKLMESCSRNDLIRYNCVVADGGARLEDLENILKELNKCQRSLQNYLDSK